MTTPTLDLDIIKLHCRIDGDDEDALLAIYAKSALRHAERIMDKKIYADSVPMGEVGVVFDDDILTACLLMIGHWYANREAVGAGEEIPFGVRELLQLHRTMGV